jgi:hypothetical protein
MMVVTTMYLGAEDILRCRGEHKKVYSGECLDLNDYPSFASAESGVRAVRMARSWYWVCEECLETGSDMLDVNFRPDTAPQDYWKLMKQLDPKCWVPVTYRG